MIQNLERIPQELKARPQWVLWKSEIRDGKPTKIPYCPQDPKRKAQADNPATWGQFEKAWQISQTDGFAGVGYEFSYYDPYCGIDLDHCRTPETGEIKPWALEIIKRFNSYTEISPSGTGVHIIIKGKFHKGAEDHQKNLPDGGKIEVYYVGRYFTVTGKHLEETPATIQDRDKELKAFHAQVIAKPKTPPKNPGPATTLELSDREIIEKFKTATNGAKFDRLWRGDISEYGGDDSSAELGFCSMVAFYTQDPEKIDRLYRASGLNREKWDSGRGDSTYGRKTIEKALSDLTETYKGPRSKPHEAPAPSPSTAQERAIIPEIIITKRFLHDKSNEAIKALETANHPPSLFRRSGSLTRISLDEKDHPRIETLSDAQLRGILARCAHFLKETEKGLVATAPPMDLVKDILALGEWTFPALGGNHTGPGHAP